ncbi:hypothetical protein [Budvicia aquatica]|uniref:hypothetical protein n=1 Tax=Budvicia aquatica TaxID=82979 RepID=UPI0020882F0B|nr:hypothetical protein [Budvicia aquatica]GKX52724.1 hypothetical protein SOASR029_30330 [Budvicia aquatica]
MFIFSIPLKVWNGIEFGGYLNIAQEVTPVSNNSRRWVSIYANYKLDFLSNNAVNYYDFLKKTKEHKYCIVDIEIAKDILQRSENIQYDDVISMKYYPADSKEELVKIIDKLKVNQEDFVPEWKCDYPLR